MHLTFKNIVESINECYGTCFFVFLLRIICSNHETPPKKGCGPIRSVDWIVKLSTFHV